MSSCGRDICVIRHNGIDSELAPLTPNYQITKKKCARSRFRRDVVYFAMARTQMWG